MKETPINWLSGMFLSWALCSLMGMIVFFPLNFVFWMINFSVGIVALIVWAVWTSKTI